MSFHDISSLSNHEAVTTFHMDFQWTVDFESRVIRGTTTLAMIVTAATAIDEILLDAKNIVLDAPTAKLFILDRNNEGTINEVPVTIKNPDSTSDLGQGAVVKLPTPLAKGTKFLLTMAHSTASDPQRCLALSWLSKQQTETNAMPYLYSQCQAIHFRTVAPCQDTPAVKTTYTARVSSSQRDATVLMSALALPGDVCADGEKYVDQVAAQIARHQQKDEGMTAETRSAVVTYLTKQLPMAAENDNSSTAAESSSPPPRYFGFVQPVPIVSYLVAIVVGNIVGNDISDRCRVYAEPSMVDRASYEFAEMELFLKTAEKFAGKYEWTRYDLVVMPPGFAYGGMENPVLTFVTPTIIAGDRSLAEVVAHEIAHSWSGNLVGIRSWRDFWLNEGFTVYLERLITRDLKGDAIGDYQGLLGMMTLERTVQQLGKDHKFTCLCPDLGGGIDPDDAFSSIPYEKGYAFLKSLEHKVGGQDRFVAWMKKYFATFKCQAISSEQMMEFFTESFPQESATVPWKDIFEKTGMPEFVPTFGTAVRDSAFSLADDVIRFDNFSWSLEACEVQFPDIESATKSWSAPHHISFLERLQAQADNASVMPEKQFSVATLSALDSSFNYNTAVNNSEILALWFSIALRTPKYNAMMPPLKKFLGSVGRMKFVRPLFRVWAQQRDKAEARAFFDKCAPGYHPITSKMVERDFSGGAATF